MWLFLDIVENDDELKKELNKNDLRFIQELIKGVDTTATEVQNHVNCHFNA